MSKKTNGVNWSKKASAKQRRANALERLNAQLKEGVKTVKGGEKVPLTEKDVTRINKEISILKERI